MTAVLVLTRIDVTQDDIDSGCRMSAQRCPVWRAAARVLPHLRPKLSVGSDWIGVEPVTKIPLPQEARTWIGSYDAGHRVTPFSFDIAVPADLIEESR